MTIALIVVSYKDRKKRTDLKSSSSFWAKMRGFDWVGNLLFISCNICLLLALQWGGGQYSWDDSHIIALLTLFGVLFAAFVASQYLQGDTASVPGRIIGQRSMICGAVYIICLSGALEQLAYFVRLL
jgi:hypothetical protein